MPCSIHPASCQHPASDTSVTSARRLNSRPLGVIPNLAIAPGFSTTGVSLRRAVAGIVLLSLTLVSGCASAPRDRGPEFVRGEGLVYPEEAKAQGIEGYVVVEYSVSKTGEVVSPRVVESKPADIFDAAALQAVAGWHYRPQVKDGAFVATPRVRSRVTFKLSGAAPDSNVEVP